LTVAGPAPNPQRSIGVATVRPPIYAYLRSRQLASDQEDTDIRHQLTAYAHQEGFTVAEFFVEPPWLSATSALDALVEMIKQTGVRDVVAPNLAHFSQAGRHRELSRKAIERQIGARIWVVEPLISDRQRCRPD
jgi:hypothetical protein